MAPPPSPWAQAQVHYVNCWRAKPPSLDFHALLRNKQGSGQPGAVGMLRETPGRAQGEDRCPLRVGKANGLTAAVAMRSSGALWLYYSATPCPSLSRCISWVLLPSKAPGCSLLCKENVTAKCRAKPPLLVPDFAPQSKGKGPQLSWSSKPRLLGTRSGLQPGGRSGTAWLGASPGTMGKTRRGA